MSVRTYRNPDYMHLLDLISYLHKVKIAPDPFVFRNGQRASTVGDLAALCKQSPADAIYHLMGGHFEPWLSYIGRNDLAETARHARKSSGSDETRLRQFLAAIQ